MALNSVLRRVCSSVVPLAVRTVGSPRTYHRAISAVLSNSKGSLDREVCRRGFVRFLEFSTASATKPSSEERFLRVLESEIECAEDGELEDIPVDFPFEIEDQPGERTILLKRNYEGENITVEVDMPTETDDGGDEAGGDEDAENPTSIPLVVNISKGNGTSLEFGVTAFVDEITIDSLSIKQPEHSEDELAYEGPDFNDLDEQLQKSLHRYLEVRGIKPSTTNYLFSYMQNKDDKEYKQWLKNLKNFIEK
ncbi:hypothetical protein HS088_TW05G00300 [Tripterygium wilfordii]|uniref:Mitochondrial glycoprotein family protein n=1 Tax=Tripterygium wilfordii TaxID=458696 RepID=A0A7J7DMI8_TRIWF|nr:uncharacterized protein At2g39795, mitochondrial-like [Tripterygium wilfordii]KAF5747575.1 hypothetical protein HS088_TW05G00300 [Tripterygium wilfordii]